jgi:membrane protease subunit HflK
MTEQNQPPGGSTPTLVNVLEKILQQFNRFKGGPIIVLVAGLVVVVLWTAWFTVQPEETGIVQRFGKVMRTAGPGLHFKLPYGIENVRLLPTARVLKKEFGFRTVSVSTVPGEKIRYDTRGAYTDESLMLTGDLNVIDVQWIVQYRIEDPIRYELRIDPHHGQRLLSIYQKRESRPIADPIGSVITRRFAAGRTRLEVKRSAAQHCRW